jgi:hypothetical protein
MAKRDWDMDKRREKVAHQGTERSEYTDIGEQIAKAKGRAKVRGTNLVKCALCDGYYPEGQQSQHQHVRYQKKPRQLRFVSAKKHPQPIRTAPLAMVIRDEFGEVVQRVRL